MINVSLTEIIKINYIKNANLNETKLSLLIKCSIFRILMSDDLIRLIDLFSFTLSSNTHI